MNKKLIAALLTVVVVICGYFYATPYIALNSIKNAAQASDSEKVSAYIDYSSVRQSFKDQMNALMVKEMASKETDSWEALGAMMATAMIDKMVDAVVTPEGMTLIMQGKDFQQSLTADTEVQTDVQAATPSKLDYSTRYLTMNTFEVTLTNLDTSKHLLVIMERDGLSWKVKKLVLPIDDLAQERSTAEPVAVQPKVEIPQVQQTTFNFSGAQKGTVMEFCYRDPCSVAKVTDFQILKQTAKDVDLELTLVGGSKGWDDTKISWNNTTHKVQITCSIDKPTIGMDGQVTVVPLNNNLGVPGVLMTDAEMYLYACHGDFNGTIENAVTKYGYNVQDEE